MQSFVNVQINQIIYLKLEAFAGPIKYFTQTRLIGHMIDRKIERLDQIQKLFLLVGNQVRFFLKMVTSTYQKNSIFYPIIDLHQKVMRLIAPPYQLLGLDIQQSEQEQPLENKANEKIVNNSYSQIKQKIEKNLIKATDTDVPQMPIISKIMKNKKYEENVGELLQTTKIQESQKQKKLPKLQRKRKELKQHGFTRPKTQKQLITETQIYNFNKDTQLKQKSKEQLRKKVQGSRQSTSRRGRKVEDWDLECKVYQWVKDEMAKGKRIRKIDIRNQFRKLSEGKFSGSRGWCRRFIGRHPQVNTWFKKSQENPSYQLMSPIRDEQNNKIEPEGKWYRADESESEQQSSKMEQSQIIAQSRARSVSSAYFSDKSESIKLSN